ncbi:MAG: ornithine carbamoyltransferase [Planctomycetes bacterium]|nr:ornithine carbamoyltransferase [Planctomycetota bacterium]
MNKLKLPHLAHKDLISVHDLPIGDIQSIYETAATLKKHRDTLTEVLRHRKLALIFEKDSLRTRFTFDIGMQDMGGGAVFLDHRDARLGQREAIKDIARNLERWVHGIVVRTFKHRAVQELAEHCDIPVINGLSDLMHPCQALTDLFTLTERWGAVKGRRMVYVGDGNNTCHSLLHATAKLGMHITVCSPEGYEPNSKVVNEAMLAAQESGAEVRIVNDPKHVARGADVVYTDVWASMGQEDETEERAAVFLDYQVDEAMMAEARPGALFLHCLPAHRGAEVTAAVMDGPHSIVFDNAENRLHVQKAILALLLNDPRYQRKTKD